MPAALSPGIAFRASARGLRAYVLRVVACGGEAQLLLEDGVHRRSALDGDARLDWSGDWYADTAGMRWLPSGAASGRLDLKHEFLD